MRILFFISAGLVSLSSFAQNPTTAAPPLPSSTWDTPAEWSKNGSAEPAKPATPPTPIATKAKAFCAYMESCTKTRPGKTAMCVKLGLKESHLLDHVIEGDTAKDLARFLRKAGFFDGEGSLYDFQQLPEGAILVLDAHDPVRDKRPACPKVYGNVLVKCNNKWIDEQKNELDFHMKRGCRTKGIWIHPGMTISQPEVKTRKRLITDPHDSQAVPKGKDEN